MSARIFYVVIPTEPALAGEWRDLLFSVSHITVIPAILADDDSMEHRYYVYILASKSRTLYIGVTSDLETRIREHRSGMYGGFTADYKVHRLVYYEPFHWVQAAISREKQLKRWRREKKVALIARDNPTWEDLSAEWGKPARLQIHAAAR